MPVFGMYSGGIIIQPALIGTYVRLHTCCSLPPSVRFVSRHAIQFQPPPHQRNKESLLNQRGRENYRRRKAPSRYIGLNNLEQSRPNSREQQQLLCQSNRGIRGRGFGQGKHDKSLVREIRSLETHTIKQLHRCENEDRSPYRHEISPRTAVRKTNLAGQRTKFDEQAGKPHASTSVTFLNPLKQMRKRIAHIHPFHSPESNASVDAGELEASM